MTTCYGVWSGPDGKWWYINSRELFYTATLGIARAQVMVANAIWEKAGLAGYWEARAIGEDGLPVGKAALLPPTSEPPRAAAEFETYPERHPCAMCGDPAKAYVDVHVKGWMCDEHKVVKLGCVPKTGTLTFVDEYMFDTKVGYWVKELMP